jgi:hypothetical protein
VAVVIASYALETVSLGYFSLKKDDGWLCAQFAEKTGFLAKKSHFAPCREFLARGKPRFRRLFLPPKRPQNACVSER